MSNDTKKPDTDKKDQDKGTTKGGHGGCGCGHSH